MAIVYTYVCIWVRVYASTCVDVRQPTIAQPYITRKITRAQRARARGREVLPCSNEQCSEHSGSNTARSTTYLVGTYILEQDSNTAAQLSPPDSTFRRNTTDDTPKHGYFGRLTVSYTRFVERTGVRLILACSCQSMPLAFPAS